MGGEKDKKNDIYHQMRKISRIDPFPIYQGPSLTSLNL